MNSLLKRQIRKHLTDEQRDDPNLSAFLESINQSYNNFDDQFIMQQRAMKISSEELSEVNQKLMTEMQAQKTVINRLKEVSEVLKLDSNASDSLTASLQLIDFIDNQTKEILEVNEQREKLLNDLAFQNKELSDYAHMVSHDLKSPLRSISTLTSWLSEDYRDNLDEEGKKTIELISENVEKMDVLISGILEYSTIGKSEIAEYDVNLQQLVTNTLKSVVVPENIKLTVAQNLPIVKGDKHRLQQLFQNLFENAIKYNDKPNGIIEIGVEDFDDKWKFHIKDNGKGIEEKYFDKIFETFQKLENLPGSSGIGLSIVKKIVNLYHGEIWVTSELGIGSTFFFTLKK